MRRYTLLLATTLAICSLDRDLAAQPTLPTAESTPASSAIDTFELGAAINVHRRGNLFFSGQFNKEDIAAIRQQGILRIISLRGEGEIDWNEQAAVEAAGLEFINIPVASAELLTDETFDRLRQLLNQQAKTTLLHCGSANRVGGVWLPYRVLDEGADLATALSEAKSIGLRAPAIQAKALDYIERKSLSQLIGEKSVKPGINTSYIDPNLDADAMVQRFEIESREVFLAREEILAACEIQQGDVVADIGAGTGFFTRMFAAKTTDQGWVYAVEISARLLEHINRESTKNRLDNITGVLGAESSVNLPTRSVDVVFICDTYHHFEYPKSTLASIHRALKDDGHMIVIDFERIPGKSREWLLGHVRAGKEVFVGEIEDAGFSLAEEKNLASLEENYFLKFTKE